MIASVLKGRDFLLPPTPPAFQKVVFLQLVDRLVGLLRPNFAFQVGLGRGTKSCSSCLKDLPQRGTTVEVTKVPQGIKTVLSSHNRSRQSRCVLQMRLAPCVLVTCCTLLIRESFGPAKTEFLRLLRSRQISPRDPKAHSCANCDFGCRLKREKMVTYKTTR